MTYLSLLPLTLGVMMACTSLSFSANDLVGLGTALASTLIFVAQSIYSKNLIGRGEKDSKQEREGKLDKVNILYYSSACSIFIMIPMALYYDGSALLFGSSSSSAHSSLSQAEGTSSMEGASVSILYICALITANGVVQFFQNFLAFSVLMLVSPVTYSIASLFKRVFVICFAIVWFGQSVSGLQWFGIILTFVGLYLYNDSKATKSITRGEEKLREEELNKGMMLPTTSTSSMAKSSSNKVGASTASSLVTTAFDTYNHIRGNTTSSSTHPTTATSINTRPNVAAVNGGPGAAIPGAGGFRDFSQIDVVSPTTSSRRISTRRPNQDEIVEINSPFYKDPRQALPSPPPSRGSSSDEEEDIPNSMHTKEN
jgi:multidrug transporter EmrE-like cation transporter